MSEYFTQHKTDADRQALAAARKLADQILTRDETGEGLDGETCTVTAISDAPSYAAGIALLSADWSAAGAPGAHDYFGSTQPDAVEASVTKIPLSVSATKEQPTSAPVEPPAFKTTAANLGDLVGASPTDPSGATY